MSKKPFFSIVIPTYNRASDLRFALFCLLRQTCKDFEIIISDNCSEDDTEEIVKKFDDRRIYYSKTKITVGNAFNIERAVKLARGQYVFIHSDDDFLPYTDSLSKIKKDIIKYKPGFLRVNYINLSPDKKRIFDFKTNKSLHNCYIPRGLNNEKILSFILGSDPYFISGITFINEYPPDISFVDSDPVPWINVLFFVTKKFGAYFVKKPHIIANWSRRKLDKNAEHHVFTLTDGKLRSENYFEAVRKQLSVSQYKTFLHNQLMLHYVNLLPAIKMNIGNEKMFMMIKRILILDSTVRESVRYWLFLIWAFVTPQFILRIIRDVYLDFYARMSKVAHTEKIKISIKKLEWEFSKERDVSYKSNIQSILFATFSRYADEKRMPTNGMVDPMLYYFVPRVKYFLLLDQPHPVSDTINPFIEEYVDGKQMGKYRMNIFSYLPIYLYCKWENKGLTRISYKLRDFVSVLIVGFSKHETFDLFIGLESINTIAGWILKKFGKVRRVVYYVSDYSPNRFTKYGKKIFNGLYLWLDRFCVKHADFTWDVSPAILHGRIVAGLNADDAGRVIHVPNGLFPSQRGALPVSKRDSKSLVYMGNLEPDFGVDLALRAFKKVKEEIPKTRLIIIGGGEYLLHVKRLVDRLGLGGAVSLFGFVPDFKDMATIVQHAYIGLAPYRSFSESIRWYGDAGKIRQYMASGLPVVTTGVPPLGRYAVEKGAGIMARDTVVSFSNAIIKLLRDKKLYEKQSRTAEKLARNNTWENSYSRALERMNLI